MTISVQNNSAAMTALQNLNRTNDQLANVQQEIATTTAVTGTFQTGANRSVRVEFFATPVEPAGSPYAANQDRQGKTFLGAVDATADADGLVDFSFTPPLIAGEQYITCTVSSTATGSFSSLGYSPGLLISGSAPGGDVGVAISDDLTRWTKVSDPVKGIGVPGRDPNVVRDEKNGRWLMYTTGGAVDGMAGVYVSES